MRKRRSDTTKCDLRTPTTEWLRQPKRQSLSCRRCLRENRSGSRGRVRLQSFGDRNHKSGAARRYESGRCRNEATARKPNSDAAFQAHASHTQKQNAPRSMHASVVVTERVGGEHGLDEEQQSSGPTGNHLRRTNARTIYRQMQISTRIWRHLPLYWSHPHRTGSAASSTNRPPVPRARSASQDVSRGFRLGRAGCAGLLRGDAHADNVVAPGAARG